MNALMEENFRLQLIKEINAVRVRFTGNPISPEEFVQKLKMPLEKLEQERINAVMIYNMYPLGFN